jgi:hypothetical protein
MIQAVYDTYDIIPVEQVVADETALPDIRLVFIGRSFLIDSAFKIWNDFFFAQVVIWIEMCWNAPWGD